MIAFIKNYTLLVIKKKLLFLYILNVLDIIFTLALLSTGLYMEVNTFMAGEVQKPLKSFAIKVVLPAVILIFIYIRMQKATDKQLKQSNILINIAVCIYILINISHMIWVSLIPLFINFI